MTSHLTDVLNRRFASLIPTQPENRAEVVSASEQSAKVTARLDITAADLCPYCGGKMTPSLSSGVPIYYCATDRHAAPRPNGE